MGLKIQKIYYLKNKKSFFDEKIADTCYFFIKKALFVLEIIKFLDLHLALFFSLSGIALEVDPRKIEKFMT